MLDREEFNAHCRGIYQNSRTVQSVSTRFKRPTASRSLLWRLVAPAACLLVFAGFVVPALQVWLALRSERNRELQQLTAVIDALTGIRFPYNAQVLRRLKGLTGAEFILVDGGALEGTLPGAPSELRELLRQATTGPDETFVPVRFRNQAYLARVLAGPRGQQLIVLHPLVAFNLRRLQAALPPLVFGLSVSLTGTIWLVWLVNRLRKDLDRIRRAVEQLPTPPPSTRPELVAADELERIHVVIREAAQRLDSMTRQVAEAERRQLTAQVAASFAHHLRNALTAARLTVELHADRCPSRSDLEPVLDELELAEHQLRGLLFLATPGPLPLEVCDPAPHTRHAARLLEDRFRHQKVAFRLDLPERLPAVRVNPDAWKTCVLSLLLNAFDATEPGHGSVELRLREQGGCVLLEVSDNGPGLPEDLSLDDVLQPYRSTKPRSLGLGLTLTNQLVSLMGGELVYERRDGRTWFRISVPCA